MKDVSFMPQASGHPQKIQVLVHSLNGTRQLAETLAVMLRAPTALGLSGPLGAGKTQFARHILNFLDVPADEVVSPSFVLETVYEISPQARQQTGIHYVYHWDLYRLAAGQNPPAELIDRLKEENSLVIVEWPEKTALGDLLSLEIVIGFGTLPEGIQAAECREFQLIAKAMPADFNAQLVKALGEITEEL